MEHHTDPKDSIILNKTLIKKIGATIFFCFIFFFAGIIIEDIMIGYAFCGLFSTPIFCAYLISKYLFGGERQSKEKD